MALACTMTLAWSFGRW